MASSIFSQHIRILAKDQDFSNQIKCIKTIIGGDDINRFHNKTFYDKHQIANPLEGRGNENQKSTRIIFRIFKKRIRK